MKSRLLFFISFLLSLAAPSAHANVFVDFNGGSGTNFGLYFPSTITFTIPAGTPSGIAPVFVISAAGNPFNGIHSNGTGTLSFRQNGGTSRFLPTLNSGFVYGDIKADDIFFFSDLNWVSYSAGDVFFLNATFLNTLGPVSGAAPADGYYEIWLANSSGTRIATGVVPEPSTCALITAALLLLGLSVLRRSKTKPNPFPAA